MQPHEYTLGQIECMILSERRDRKLYDACSLLRNFLEDRARELQGYQVQKEVALIRDKRAELPRRKVTSVDDIELGTCVMVDE